MICPKCGENNSDGFRFCGMCGTLLEIRSEARRPAGAPIPHLPKIADAAGPPQPLVVEDAFQPATNQAPPVAGLHQPGVNRQPRVSPSSPNQPSPYQSGPSQSNPSRSSPNPPNIDSLNNRSFSGIDFFFTPETTKQSSRQSREQSSPEPSKSSAWRTLLLLALLAALGVAGWWTYTNYLGVAESRKPDAPASSVGESSAEKPSTNPAAPTAAPAPTNDANSSQPVSPSAKIAGGQSEKAHENASAAPNSARKTADREPTPETKPAAPPKIQMKTAPANQSAAKREPIAPSAKPSNPPAPAAADTGDAAFRKGEAFLYGRGVKENCDEAVKNLKAASAKSNARARSVLGTMYDTGHCVPRDLPTSYLWFALALRADPNNQILEKDLSAVWNQMTPPERQMATKMKQ